MMKTVCLMALSLVLVVAVAEHSPAYSVMLTDFEGRPAEAAIEITGDGTNQITFEVLALST